MDPKPLYVILAELVEARANCEEKRGVDWARRHRIALETLAEQVLPNGAGFDRGTRIDLDLSMANCIVLTTAFHHMTDGSYDGWTEHTVYVKPSLAHGFVLRVTGRDRNDIKDYIYQLFDHDLRKTFTSDDVQTYYSAA